MLDSIQVGLSGLLGYSKGLRVVANNTANLNTPGYKSSSLQFTDMFYATSEGAPGGRSQFGYGLATAGTHMDFRQGDLRETGNDLDLGLDGDGLFVLRDTQGRTRYTRAGMFQFDAEGLLVNRTDGSHVIGVDAAGRQGEVSIAGMRTTPGTPTATVRFTGNLSSTSANQTVGSIKVYDALGEEHLLSLKFTNTASTTPGSWHVELLDGTTSVGTADMVFEDGKPQAASAKLTFTYTPAGRAAQSLVFDFSADVTSFASGNLSTLAMASQDGRPPGNLTKSSFNARGVLVATYSNGQTVEGARLLLARFRSTDAVADLGGSQYEAADGQGWIEGGAGDAGFGALRAGVLEISNVDLSREFSDLVVMQRGYQASSQVVSTANEMLQELFNMKNK
jgi:flagellar hook protein FlgE